MSNNLILTKDQNDAIISIRDWWTSKSKIFVLSGYAGTGKTTLIKKFIDEQVKAKTSVSISAPTHKAKKVISKIIYREAVTLHSLLGLRMGIELSKFDPHNPTFQQERGKSTFHEYQLVVIDEASMINQYLLELILSTINETKVIFMGDSAQLPPVNEDNPPVFSMETNSFNLTKVIRQADSNPLLDVFTDVRKVISLEMPVREFKEVTILDSRGQGIEYIHSLKEWRPKILEYFSSDEYELDSDYAKVITYTNERVEHYNKFIRSHLFPTGSNQIEVGEVFMSYDSIYDQNIPILDNSADYIVESISDEMNNADGNAGYFIKLKETNSELRARSVFILKSDRENLRKAGEESLLLLSEAKQSYGYNRRLNFAMFFDYKNRNLSQQTIKINGQLCLSASLKNGYAITCHKAQGSTYGNVFIDQNDMERNHNSVEKWKLKYVAMTRPSTKAFVFSKVKKQLELEI
jgi:hypothetical protein